MRRPGKRMAAIRAMAAAGLAALCLCGCFVARERFQADEPLRGARIDGLRRGATTRQEILERFGPPVAVARRGTTMVFPAPGPVGRARADVRSDAFLELFSTGRALRDAEIVYYYDSSRAKATGVLIIPIVGGGFYSHAVAVERLWLLIDGDTGLVEDYVFRGAD